jgi:hypothetical protein
MVVVQHENAYRANAYRALCNRLGQNTYRLDLLPVYACVLVWHAVGHTDPQTPSEYRARALCAGSPSQTKLRAQMGPGTTTGTARGEHPVQCVVPFRQCAERSVECAVCSVQCATEVCRGLPLKSSFVGKS